MRSLLTRLGLRLTLAVAALLAVGCSPAGTAAGQLTNGVAPTVAPMFLAQAAIAGPEPQATMDAPGTGTQLLLPAAGGVPLGSPTASAASPMPAGTSRPGNPISELTIYDDTLNADWSTEHTDGMNYSLTDSSHAYSGTVGAALEPQQDFGRFYLTVREGAQQTYGVDRVFGVSFWLNSGSEALDPSNLAVTVVGSNAYPYWVADDNSVTVDAEHFFAETRLYYLDINRPIPPDTWVEVVVRLDRLRYEPDYKYLTGIYIKNDAGFKRPFYIDQVRLLLVG